MSPSVSAMIQTASLKGVSIEQFAPFGKFCFERPKKRRAACPDILSYHSCRHLSRKALPKKGDSQYFIDVFAFVGGFFQRLLIFLRFAYIIEKEKIVPVGQSSAERSADMKRKLKTPKSTAMPSEKAAVILEKPKKDLLLGVLLAAAAVLFFAMLALCGVYLNMRTATARRHCRRFRASDRWILTGSGGNLAKRRKILAFTVVYRHQNSGRHHDGGYL